MVEFHLVAALVAGLAATVVMTVMMNAAKAAGMTNMPPMPLVMGSMMSGNRRTATGIGAMMHFVVMGTVIFGLGYTVLFTVFDNDAWWLGMVIGLVHGLVVGAMAMPMMPSVHPRMERDATSRGLSGGATVTERAGEVRVAAPGMLGSRWGQMTPIGILMGHAIYGVVLALVYGWVAGG